MKFVFNISSFTVHPLHPPSTLSTSHLPISGGFDVRVAFLADDVIDMVQAISRNARKGSGTVRGKVAAGSPSAAKISRSLYDHSCRSESLKKKREKKFICTYL